MKQILFLMALCLFSEISIAQIIQEEWKFQASKEVLAGPTMYNEMVSVGDIFRIRKCFLLGKWKKWEGDLEI